MKVLLLVSLVAGAIAMPRPEAEADPSVHLYSYNLGPYTHANHHAVAPAATVPLTYVAYPSVHTPAATAPLTYSYSYSGYPLTYGLPYSYPLGYHHYGLHHEMKPAEHEPAVEEH